MITVIISRDLYHRKRNGFVLVLLASRNIHLFKFNLFDLEIYFPIPSSSGRMFLNGEVIFLT